MPVPPSPETRIKILEAFCTVALRFEKDMRTVGVSEIPHLLSVARAAAEEALEAALSQSPPQTAPRAIPQPAHED